MVNDLISILFTMWCYSSMVYAVA